MTSGRYRKGRLCQIGLPEHRQAFLDTIENDVKSGRPIEIIIPSFPLKFTHPLKTSCTTADMAEISALAKLHEMCEQIGKVYPQGANVYIIRDGGIYANVFGRNRRAVDNYGKELQFFVDKMGLKKEIKFLDLKAEMERQPDFHKMHAIAEAEIREAMKNPKEHGKNIDMIKCSAAANLNVKGLPRKEVERVFMYPESSLTHNEIILKRSLRGRGERAAFDYLVVNRTIELLDLYCRVKPNALRASVHVGPGKLPLQLHRKKTQLLPWMGVGMADKRGLTVRYISEMHGDPKYVPVYLKGHENPFYYRKKIIKVARH